MRDAIKIVGYGTFMTHSLAEMQENGLSQTWGIPVKINKLVEVKGYRRYMPSKKYPFAIPEERSAFLALSFDLEKKHLAALDKVEAEPYEFFRQPVDIDGESHYIYIPNRNAILREAQKIDLKEAPDMWHYEVLAALNDIAKRKFPEFFDWKIVK